MILMMWMMLIVALGTFFRVDAIIDGSSKESTLANGVMQSAESMVKAIENVQKTGQSDTHWILPGEDELIKPPPMEYLKAVYRNNSQLVQDPAFVEIRSRMHAAANASTQAGDKDCKDLKNCKTCVFVLARMRKGINSLLPAICAELNVNYPKCYKACHEVLNALQVNGGHVKRWFTEGCTKVEIYGESETVTPCPPHAVCSALYDFEKKPFCDMKKKPFEDVKKLLDSY